MLSREPDLEAALDAAGVEWTPLGEREEDEAERQWRAVYGRAFRGRTRLHHGAKAEHEYARLPAGLWLIVPLTSPVEGTPIQPTGRQLCGYECVGPVVPLGAWHDVELTATSADLAWTMLYTHEDHALGGPYFVRREWLLGE